MRWFRLSYISPGGMEMGYKIIYPPCRKALTMGRIFFYQIVVALILGGFVTVVCFRFPIATEALGKWLLPTGNEYADVMRIVNGFLYGGT